MGKKGLDARATEAKRLQTQLTEACKQKSVDRALELFGEWEASDIPITQNVFAQVLAPLAGNETQQDGDTSRNYFQHAKRIFERAQTVVQDWSSTGESIYTLMVRLAARAGEPYAAVEYLNRMRQPPVSMRPKLRTFIPILEAYALTGASEEAERLYREDLFVTCGPSEATSFWNTALEDRLWQSVFALRLRAWTADNKSSGALDLEERKRGLDGILEDLRAVCPQIRADGGVVEALKAAMDPLQWRTGCAHVGPDGICPITRASLQVVTPTHEELKGLSGLIERLAVDDARDAVHAKRVQEEWSEFKAWLEMAGREFDTVLDGANVGHHNQNFEHGAFSHEQIGEVIEQCLRSGRQKVAVVLRKWWLDPENSFTMRPVKRKKRKLAQLLPDTDKAEAVQPVASPSPERSVDVKDKTVGFCQEAQQARDHAELSDLQRRVVEYAEDWQRRGVLVISPPSIDDDWVSLYIAIVMCFRCASDVQLVSNDEFRDHFWRMRQPVAFRHWRERHVTQYHIQRDRREGSVEDMKETSIQSIQLFPPALYSSCVQRGASGRYWHFPIRPEIPEADAEEPAAAAPSAPSATSSNGRNTAAGVPAGTVRMEATHRIPAARRLEWLVAWDPSCVPNRGS